MKFDDSRYIDVEHIIEIILIDLDQLFNFVKVVIFSNHFHLSKK